MSARDRAARTETAEQAARDLLSRLGVPGAQSYTSGDLVELANMFAREREAAQVCPCGKGGEGEKPAMCCTCGHSCVDHLPAKHGHCCELCGCPEFRERKP